MSAILTFSPSDGHPWEIKVAELLGKHGFGHVLCSPICNCEGLPTVLKDDPCAIGRISDRLAYRWPLLPS